ncbi:hypothetical protein JFT59_04860 [Pseudomonas sp. MF6784]|uniref:hypothetical protein n=1 Tax=Pseudomonas sp. MF6784 TaxID=2797535 RepID=UPI0018E8F97D|nr:hypothetical protein [Pseudomonas sp. MF6784]MBJ2250533.1 hypothetical protein [Pseudomonas sp. MF6784]
MTQKPKETSTPKTKKEEGVQSEEKKINSCFIIMPIADMEGYEPGHFSRVYEHLIKPACFNAGFEPHRADFVDASNYIIIDILRKILDSDLVVCDLSGRNPNVLYELGVRQAFNLPTVLIKDAKTPKIFDIQGLRYTEYNDSLRIDEVEKERERIKAAITATASNPNDVNSMIQLLGVKSAPLPHKVELSDETNVILESLKDISVRMSRIESSRNTPLPTVTQRATRVLKTILQTADNQYQFNDEKFTIGDEIFLSGKSIGELLSVNASRVSIKTKNNNLIVIETSDPEFAKLSVAPF